MNIQQKKLKDLKDSEYNPRKISEEVLKKLEDSMTKFGYVEPIIWNKRSGNVVGGHQRLKILRKQMKEDDKIDCVVVDLDKYQEKALNIALNKVVGEWDETRLGELLVDIKENSVKMLMLPGFNDEELDMYFKIASSAAQETEGRDKVITVEPPNAPPLKERLSIYCENEKDYKAIKKALGDMTDQEKVKKLLEVIK